MTWPLITKIWNCIPKDTGDPLANSWIMAWDIHKIKTGLTDFWDANIFYPNKSTLAYSEHLIPNALIILPVYLVSNNIVFSYNFIFLLTFIMSGYGAYLLTRYLTGSSLAGIISGMIFAFAPF